MSLASQPTMHANPETKGSRDGRSDDGSVASCEDGLHGKSTGRVKLERTLSLFDGIMINVGVMIGAGIFISPKGVLAGVQSVGATVLVWVSSGLISLIGSLCYAELGTMINASGGTYTYIFQTMGECAAFVYFWAMNIFANPCSNAVTALTFSYYCLQPFYPDDGCPMPSNIIRLVAVLCLMFVVFINCWGVRLSSVVQDGTSIIKLLALGIIIIVGMVMLAKGNTTTFNNPFESTNVKGLGIALYSSLYSYSGWESLNTIVGELKNPTRNLPIAIAMSIAIVTTVYTLTNIAYFSLLSPSELLNSDAVAFSFADKILGKFALAIPIAVAISCLGGLNGSVLTDSRAVFVGAIGGHFPRIISMISVRRKTPTPSLIYMGLITCCFCFYGDVYTLINYFSVVKWTSYVCTAAGLLYLRVKQPDRIRPFKVNTLVAVAFLIVCVFLLVTGFIAAPVDAAIGCAIMFSAVPFYMLGVRYKTRQEWAKRANDKIVTLCQKILFVLPEDDDT